MGATLIEEGIANWRRIIGLVAVGGSCAILVSGCSDPAPTDTVEATQPDTSPSSAGSTAGEEAAGRKQPDREPEAATAPSVPAVGASNATDAPATTTGGSPPGTDGVGCVMSVAVTGDVELLPQSPVEPGDDVTATWSVRNDGSCSWTSADSWVFTGGDPVTIVEVSSMEGVMPGDATEVWVNVRAPDIPGVVAAQWQFLPRGEMEPIGPPVAAMFEVSES